MSIRLFCRQLDLNFLSSISILFVVYWEIQKLQVTTITYEFLENTKQHFLVIIYLNNMENLFVNFLWMWFYDDFLRISHVNGAFIDKKISITSPCRC